MLESAFFGISFLSAYISIYCCKKTEKLLNGIAWMNITLVIMLCYHTLVAGVLNLLNVRINLISIGCFDLALFIIFVLLYFKGIIQRQKYSYAIKDGIIVTALLVCVVIKFIMQFGVQLNIHYITSDPSVHLYLAKEVIESGKVDGMYFGSLINALFMEFLEPIFSGFFMYKSFILMDGIMLFISGLSFFSVMRQEKSEIVDKKMVIPEILLLLMYVLAYPLNNMVFGFVYLGMSVSIIATIIVVANLYLQSESIELYCKFFLMLLCLGLALCYVLFAPVIYFSVFACVAYKYLTKGMIKKWVRDNLTIFVVPCILATVYCFFGMFSGNVQSIEQGIQTEGYIYKDIFMNAWIIILPLFAGLFSFMQKKKICMETIGFALMTVFVAMLGAAGLKELISPYYFYKSNYMMVLFLYAIAYEGILCFGKESKKVLLGYCSSVILIFALFLGEFEDWVSQKNNQFIPYNKLALYLDIYEFNNTSLENYEDYNYDKLELYHQVYEGYKENIICIGEWMDCYWYEALTNQKIDSEKYYPWKFHDKEIFWNNIAQDESIEYILVLKDSEIYEENIKRFEGFEIKFENNQGIIFVLDNLGRKQLIRGERYETKQ